VISTGDMKKIAEASASGKTVIDVKNNILAITNISPRKKCNPGLEVFKIRQPLLTEQGLN
jgi:hypothetical protein